jgi:DNA/RNA-binding domain of Phe-tRNA-synthetase-like protein
MTPARSAVSAGITATVSPEVFALRPDYCALSVVAEGVTNSVRHPQVTALAEAIGHSWHRPAWTQAHLEAWRTAYRAFGAKPQRTPCSAEALLKRLDSDGSLPSVNAAVDLYNAISVGYAIPVGGENAAAYTGNPRLIRATGHESFDTLKDGIEQVETVPSGEVVWRDDRGVTCRRWNWRQCIRTRIGEGTQAMWFVLERLEPMPLVAVMEAGQLLVATLSVMSPDARIAMTLISREGAVRNP